MRDAVREAAALASIALAALGAAAPASAQVYVNAGAEEGAAIVLSNFESAATPRLLIAGEAAAPPAAANAVTTPAAPAAPPAAGRRRELEALVAQVAAAHGLPPALMNAVVARESSFDPQALSPKGAMGLMQLMPATARQWGVRSPFDPLENLRAGARHLRALGERFGQRADLALAAYNAGEAAVRQAGGRVPRIAETQDYVGAILAAVRCRSLLDCTAP